MITFKGSSIVFFHENGEVSYGTLASGDQTLQVGSGANAKMVTFEESTAVNFHENGEVSHGTLASGDQTLQVGSDANAEMITFKGNTRVFFHENGEISHGTLVPDETIKGVTYPTSVLINLDDEGNVVNVITL